MSYFYPQASMTLGIIWEDFKFTSDASLQEAYSLPVMAKSVTVNVNDYTSADTFEAEIDYKMFPFDPRTIRALRVTIHMQDVGKLYHGTNSLNALNRTAENTIFIGFADEESISFDDDKRTVKIEGRDLTALLIDKHYLGGPIPLTDPLDVAIQNILNQIPETAQGTSSMQIDLRGVEKSDMPVLANFMTADGDHKLNGHKNVDRDENYWEVIQDIIARAGFISFVELDKLVITRPRALYNASSAKIFVYGSNIKNLTMKRKIGRKKTFNVIMRSFNLQTKEVIEAKIPAEATADWSRATGISQGEVKIPELGPKGEQIEQAKWKPAPYMSFRIPNCKDKDHLIAAAQEVYEEIGRQQIEGQFETRDMIVLQGIEKRSNFDVLKIRNGTPIQILIDQGDLRGIADVRVLENGKIEPDATARKRAKYLIDRGYEVSIANAFARSMDKFANIFYTKAIKFSLDAENGFEASIEFLNFIDTKLNPPSGNT